jgi:hypothetical protein
LLLAIGVSAASVTIAAAQQLAVGPVLVKLGEPEATVIDDLRKHYKVKPFAAGWSVEPLDGSRTAPMIGVLTQHGRIESVSITWGPGFTPATEEIAEQLAHAFPDRARCEVRNIAIRQDGGTVRTLEWVCGKYKVHLVTGVHPGGNTASIDIALY